MTTDQDDTIPKEQAETALHFLEQSHGMALEYNEPKDAHAYYNAVDIVEAALNENLRPPDDLRHGEREINRIELSRDARDDGYAAATLLHESTRDRYEPRPGLLDRLRAVIQKVSGR